MQCQSLFNKGNKIVQKFWTILLISILIVAPFRVLASNLAGDRETITVPVLTSTVIDMTQTISPEGIDALTKKISDHERNTSDELVVVVLDSLHGHAIEEYALQMARTWKIGKKEKDNGVLFVIAPIEKKVRIEVGYGLEGVLTDAKCKSLIEQTIIPQFQRNQMETGIILGLDAICNVLNSVGALTNNIVLQDTRDLKGFFKEKYTFVANYLRDDWNDEKRVPMVCLLLMMYLAIRYYEIKEWQKENKSASFVPAQPLRHGFSRVATTYQPRAPSSSRGGGGSFGGGGSSVRW